MRTRADGLFSTVRAAFLAAGLFAVLLAACGKDEEARPPAPPPPAPQARPPAPPAPETPEEKPVYVYQGDTFRDPFVPAGVASTYSPQAVFDPARAKVRGIIFGGRYRSAVITVGEAGTYFVTGSRIFDVMGKNVPEFSARIFDDRVVIKGEADTVFELKLRDEEEEETL